MRLIQSIVTRDHEAIETILASGVHPLANFERVARLRYDAVATLLHHVSPDHYPVVLALAKHLWAINNFPEARVSLRNWLIRNRPKKSPRELDRI